MQRTHLRLVFAIVGTTVFGSATNSWAHTQMTMPMPREVNPSGAIKTAPCGADPKPTTAVPASNTFKPGQSIPMAWTEIIGHPGWFRVALDQDGQDDFVDPTLADYNKFIANPQDASLAPQPTTKKVGNMWVLSDYLDLHANGTNGMKWTTMVTLPNVTCAHCTLQLIQVMADTGHPYPGSRYYHCADIAIAGDASVDAGAPDASRDSAASGGTAGGGAGGAAGAGGNPAAGAGAGTTGQTAGVSGSGGGASGGAAAGRGGAAGVGGTGGGAGASTRDSGGGCSASPTGDRGSLLALALASLATAMRLRRAGARNRRR